MRGRKGKTIAAMFLAALGISEIVNYYIEGWLRLLILVIVFVGFCLFLRKI